MKRLLIICLVFTAFMSSCTKLIKNEHAIVENEQESMTAKGEFSSSKDKKASVVVLTDLKGLWVGTFNASQELLTKKLVDRGNTAWHKEHKITIAIDSIQGSTISGYSIIAGLTRVLTGTLQETKTAFEATLSEKGRDSQNGVFSLRILKNDSILQGGWSAINSIPIHSRFCRLAKRAFSYNPNVDFVNVQDIKEDMTIKTNVVFPSEYNEWYEAVESDYNIVYTLNPSINTLSDSDVESLSRAELMLLRNTIFARHGYAFKKRPLRIYFEKQPWYTPISSNPKAGLTTIENQNIATILRYERNFGQYDGEYGR